MQAFQRESEKRQLLIPFHRRCGFDLYHRVILGSIVVKDWLVCSVDSAGSPSRSAHETVRATSVFVGSGKALSCKLQKIMLETAKT